MINKMAPLSASPSSGLWGYLKVYLGSGVKICSWVKCKAQKFSDFWPSNFIRNRILSLIPTLHTLSAILHSIVPAADLWETYAHIKRQKRWTLRTSIPAIFLPSKWNFRSCVTISTWLRPVKAETIWETHENSLVEHRPYHHTAGNVRKNSKITWGNTHLLLHYYFTLVEMTK